MKKSFKLLIVSMFLVPLAYGIEDIPQWWVDRGLIPSIENESNPETIEANYSVATIGHLMNMAECAAAELDEKVQGGAGDVIHALVASFTSYDEGNPTANYKAATIGQLKTLAEPFFNRLHELPSGHVVWPQEMIFEDGNGKYPWPTFPTNPTNEDYNAHMAAANLGQLKYLFSWSLVENAIVDSDGDGMDDSWEMEHFGNLSTVGAETDYDGDGMSDFYEFSNGFDPKNEKDASLDKDNDGLSNIEELRLGTSPNNPDTDGDGIGDKAESSIVGGYLFEHSDSSEWVDISQTGNEMLGLKYKDDESQVIHMGFSIDMLGSEYSSIYVSTNGTVSMGYEFNDYSNAEYSWVDNPIFFPFWDDLELTSNSDSKIVYQIFDDDRIIISWLDVAIARDTGSNVNFQMELSKNGGVIYRYAKMQNGSSSMADGKSATVGMQFNERYYFNVSCNKENSVSSYTSVILTPVRLDPLNPDQDGDGIYDGWELKYSLNPFKKDDALLDNDGDELTNFQEYQLGTDPNSIDTDGDGMNDGDEVLYGLNPAEDTQEDREADSDGDGIPNWIEIRNSLNPFDASDAALDKDNDGLSNLEEYRLGTEIRYQDSDGDGLNDKEEIEIGTDPCKRDTDGDGLSDKDEYDNGLDPLQALASDMEADSDSDGIPNGVELENWLNPFYSHDANMDSDSDGLTNLQEYQLGTNIRERDTDGDGLPDGWELENGFDPLNALPEELDADTDGDGIPNYYEAAHNMDALDPSDAERDYDGDGLTNLQEYQIGTDPNYFDTDEDGFSDGDEYNNGFDPLDPSDVDIAADYDGDGIPNGWEVQHGMLPFNASDALEDYDGDGLNNLQEFQAGTEIWNRDTDGDGLSDGDEVAHNLNPIVRESNAEMNKDHDNDGIPTSIELKNGLNPFSASDALGDLDGDGLTNLQEFQIGSKMNDSDTDNDGISDGDEYMAGSDIFRAEESASDSDGDGMPDVFEELYGLNKYDPGDAAGDSDHDGFTNYEEYLLGTNPKNWDTDGDGLSDKQEVDYGNKLIALYGRKNRSLSIEDYVRTYLNPRVWTDIHADTDGDGLTLLEEFMYGTNPNSSDSDNDGYGDYTEIKYGYNPTDPAEGGDVDSGNTVDIELVVGDPSGSESEKYALHVGDFTYFSEDYGVVSNDTFKFQKGKKYDVWLEHVGSNLEKPDYDFQIEINPKTNKKLVGVKDDNVLIQNTGDSGEKELFFGKHAYMYILKFNFETPKALAKGEELSKENLIAEGEGKNAYTYDQTGTLDGFRSDTIKSGKFNMDIRLSVSPDDAPSTIVNEAVKVLNLELKIHGSIKRMWASGNDNGKPTYDGTYLNASVQCENLPPRNKDFGTRVINLNNSDTNEIEAQTKFQMFYALRGANNPSVTIVPYGNKGASCFRPVNLVLYYSDAFNLLNFSSQDKCTGAKNSHFNIYSMNADGRKSLFDPSEFKYVAGIATVNAQPVTYFKRSGSSVTNTLSYMQLFRYSSNHEDKHVQKLVNWWITPENYASKKPTEDTDGDYIPDKYEYREKDGEFKKDATDEQSIMAELAYFPYTPAEMIMFRTGTQNSYSESDDFNFYVNSHIPLLTDFHYDNDWGNPGTQHPQN